MPVPLWSLGLEKSRASLGTLLVVLGGGTARPYRSYKRIALDDIVALYCFLRRRRSQTLPRSLRSY